MDTCLEELAQSRETQLDLLLSLQVRCQLLTNCVTCPEAVGGTADATHSRVLQISLSRQLNSIRRSLPMSIISMSEFDSISPYHRH